MKNKELPVREIRVILNGTCNIPAYLKYAYRHKKKQEIGYNIQSDIMFDSIAQSYLPNLQAHTLYHKYHVKLDKQRKEKQQLLKNQKALTKSKDKNNAIKKIYYQNRIVNTDSNIAETKKNILKIEKHMDNDSRDIAVFFDQLGTTTIGSSQIKLGIYRGPGTKHENQLQDALFGQSMSRRITKVAEEIYESLLESAEQDPLPQVNIQGFSRGAYSALLVTEKLNYLIEHGNRRIDEHLIKQGKQSTGEAKAANERKHAKRQYMYKMLQQKPITIHCCANDPIPGLGSTRSSGIYHFDRPNTQVENHIFTHYNTAHNQYGFQGECTNQVLSSLCGINQNQHVQSGFIKHSSLQKPIITGPLRKVMEKAFADTKKSVKLPDYFHPHTIPGLYTLGMFIRDINKTYEDDPETRYILTRNTVDIFNKHIKIAREQRQQDIPYIKAPTSRDLGLINLIMKNTLPIQKFELGKIIRENTGGKLQETISESTLYYAHDRARTALEENISYTPRSLDTEKILNKLNKTSISKTLLQQRWEDIHASGQNINSQTVNYDPHDYDDNKTTSFFMNWLLQPIYQIQYLISTDDHQLTKLIKLRDTLKLQIKTSIIELKKSTAAEFHALLKDHSTHQELREIYDTTGTLVSKFDTVMPATAIKNINDQQASASKYESDLQNYIQLLATKKLSKELAFVNDYAQKVSTVLSKLDLLYQKVHSLEDISKKVYHQKIQSFTEDLIELFTEYGLEGRVEPILHNTIHGIDSISTSLNGELHFNNILLYSQRVCDVLDSLTEHDEKTQYGILQLHAIQTRLTTAAGNSRYLSQFYTKDIKDKINNISAYINTELNGELRYKDISEIVNRTHTLLDKLQREEILNVTERQIQACTRAHSNFNNKEKSFLSNSYTSLQAAYKNLAKGINENAHNFYELLKRFVDNLRLFLQQVFHMQKAKSFGFAPGLHQPALEYRALPKKK